jgi:hypothetical protein
MGGGLTVAHDIDWWPTRVYRYGAPGWGSRPRKPDTQEKP